MAARVQGTSDGNTGAPNQHFQEFCEVEKMYVWRMANSGVNLRHMLAMKKSARQQLKERHADEWRTARETNYVEGNPKMNRDVTGLVMTYHPSHNICPKPKMTGNLTGLAKKPRPSHNICTETSKTSLIKMSLQKNQ
eukprot:gene9480-8848_t